MAKYAAPANANVDTANCIDYFRGEYGFLSNMYSAKTTWEGVTYPTSEHAFVASKTDNPFIRARIAAIKQPGEAKVFGRTVKLCQGWNQNKFQIMYEIILAKFTQNGGLKEKLLATGTAELIEGNTWKDFTWGVCDGQGENHLGKILMRVRKELRKKQ